MENIINGIVNQTGMAAKQAVSSYVPGPYDGVRNQLKSDEGFRSVPYLDTTGNMTVGYGFNMGDPTMRKLIPISVMRGERGLGKQESENIFNHAYNNAFKTAIDFVGPDVFGNLPVEKQGVLVNMAYNLGGNKLGGFERFKKALIGNDFSTASKEMLDSDWAKQVKGRATRLSKIMGQ